MTLRTLLEPAIRAVGIEGVSIGILLPLLAVALYAHKVSTVGGAVVGVGSTLTHDLKVVALILAAGLVLGVISLDPGRLSEVVQMFQRELAQAQLLEELQRWLLEQLGAR